MALSKLRSAPGASIIALLCQGCPDCFLLLTKASFGTPSVAIGASA